MQRGTAELGPPSHPFWSEGHVRFVQLRPAALQSAGRRLHWVLAAVLLHQLRQQQRWARVSLPMVRVPRVGAPAELVGLVPEPQPREQARPFGARCQLTHE